MTTYYNEFDPKAAAWLRELIRCNQIAPGEVDTRSITDVKADDLRGFTQCHFFAGIGGWAYALRLAGVPDDYPVWTGSCPCQPFSCAGKGKGVEDERHLWPVFRGLITECNPPIVFGEQVASKAGKLWLDTVRIEMEALGYAVGAADLCAASVGAPHIRQRLYFVGVSNAESARRGFFDSAHVGATNAPGDPFANSGYSPVDGCRPVPLWLVNGLDTGLGDSSRGRFEGPSRSNPGQGPGIAEHGLFGGMADNVRPPGREIPGSSPCHETENGGEGRDVFKSHCDNRFTGNGEDCPADAPNALGALPDWLYCRDGKWRPVESGTFPLAHGVPARVGRLRGYGNAIVPQVAQAFIKAALS